MVADFTATGNSFTPGKPRPWSTHPILFNYGGDGDRAQGIEFPDRVSGASAARSRSDSRASTCSNLMAFTALLMTEHQLPVFCDRLND
jgi:hypothetical protein